MYDRNLNWFVVLKHTKNVNMMKLSDIEGCCKITYYVCAGKILGKWLITFILFKKASIVVEKK